MKTFQTRFNSRTDTMLSVARGITIAVNRILVLLWSVVLCISIQLFMEVLFVSELPFVLNSLVSTHIVCARLSAMQDLAWVLRIFAQNPKNIVFLARIPYPPGLEFLMEDLGSSGLRLLRIPPPPRNENCSGLWI